MEKKNYSQINFDFSTPSESDEPAPTVGVRLKAMKPVVTETPEPVENVEPVEGTTDIVEVPIEVDLPIETVEIAESANNGHATGTPAKKSTRGRKSLKALDAEADLVNIPSDETLFQRQYYAIGEVAAMFGVNQSLLRFWENEFDILQPRKNRKGDRHFRPVDIKNLELIYDLLRRRKLTIEGAKDFLKKNKQARERFEMIQSLQHVKGFLLEIKASL